MTITDKHFGQPLVASLTEVDDDDDNNITQQNLRYMKNQN